MADKISEGWCNDIQNTFKLKHDFALSEIILKFDS